MQRRGRHSACLLFFLGATLLVATPANKRALQLHFGSFLPARLDSCATCHVRAHADGAESLEAFPHNPFGAALNQPGTDASLSDRLQALSSADSDGDGRSNLEEILAGSFPGDAKSEAAPESPGADLLRRYAAFRDRYPWQPFAPVRRPAGPDGGPGSIDAFVNAGLRTHGLRALPAAEPAILLRRVYLDLIGLSPTRAEQRAFLENPTDTAYSRIVAQLLDRPEYGERWGRHWMDIWRYSDWAGYKDALRDSQRHIWRWRDWIIDSLNADKPYDRMVLEMLAGDELDPDNEDAVRGTGYLARHYFAERDQWMDNIVKHTSQAFLGITLGCSKCHDHMYDPFPQKDYYAFRAIFEPYHVRTDRVPGVLDILKDGQPRAYDRTVDAKTYLFERGDERHPLRDQAIAPDIPHALGGRYTVTPVTLPVRAHSPARRGFVVRDLLAAAEAKLEQTAAEADVKAARAELDALKAELELEKLEETENAGSDRWTTAAKRAAGLKREAALAVARADLERGERAETMAQAEVRGAKSAAAKTKAGRTLSAARKQITTARKNVAAAEKALQQPLTPKFARRKIDSFPKTSSGRRLAFARWLTDPANPLTARVAVNHVWARHFGHPIVPTVTEFGANGREPTHPALLDWLAAEFMNGGWSIKRLHRLMVTSDVYRRAGTTDEENSRIDPDNLRLWRMNARRMEGEIVRDNLLHVAGTLDRTLGGPDIDHQLAQTSTRRSIYLRHAHEKLVEFVQIFDGPKVSECYLREESVQPHQALALANSRITHDQSEALVGKLHEEAPTADTFIDAAFASILCRPPKPEELRLCRDFLARDEARGRTRLVNVLFNHNDFVTIR